MIVPKHAVLVHDIVTEHAWPLIREQFSLLSHVLENLRRLCHVQNGTAQVDMFSWNIL